MSEPYDRSRWELDESAENAPRGPSSLGEDLEAARENVFDGWPSSEDVSLYVQRASREGSAPQAGPSDAERDAEPAAEPMPFESGPSEPGPPEPVPAFRSSLDPDPDARPEPGGEPDPDPEPSSAEDAVAFGTVPVADPDAPEADPGAPAEAEPSLRPEELHPVALTDAPAVQVEHAPGALVVPPGYGVLEGTPDGRRRAVGVVVSRFNGDVTSRLLAGALEELGRSGVAEDSITVMPVPGAFELPIGAMALARTRRFACIVALGCVVRGETPHFDYVAGEAASGLQLAALETGVPVAFGVLTLESADQAEARIDKGAEAVRTALEMADLFSHLRAAAAR
jgi:6,7-dimethyl-8-ribityllumazine synthase